MPDAKPKWTLPDPKPPTEPGTLASVGEIAEILRVKKARAGQISRNVGFPAPVDELAVGRVWRRVDVEAYRRDHRPGDD